jgi:hypothetical protein
MKAGCPKKPSKTTQSKKRASATKKQKRAVATTVSQTKRKRKAASAVVVKAPQDFVPKPQPKPMLTSSSLNMALVERMRQYQPSSGLQADTLSASCGAELATLGVEFTVPDRVEGTEKCKVIDPVQITTVQTTLGQVDLPATPVLNCQFARKFTLWLSNIAAPVVAALGDARLASLSTGPGYECRGRNGNPSAKLSEHATGNAIDIAGITLSNNRRIEISDVADNQDPDHRMLMALRISACGYFTTVLGPGADDAHASHYHFDLGVHGKSGNYRICE